jgi:hypothetical protein
LPIGHAFRITPGTASQRRVGTGAPLRVGATGVLALAGEGSPDTASAAATATTGTSLSAVRYPQDWSGVIIGPDLVWRGDRWITDRTASRNPVFKKSIPDTDVDRLIRNTYKVVLTRGMVGTIVYSTDAETRGKLRKLVGGVARETMPV